MVTARAVRAAFGLVAVTGVLLVFGSTVRVHGAGLACPDWPLCFGRVVPAIDFQVGLEYFHRVLAGCVSLGFLGLGAWAWRAGVWAASGRFRALYAVAVAALATQIVLGGLTVLQLLAEWTVASHLITGNTFCALLLMLALTLRDLRDGERPIDSGGGAWLVVVLAALVPAQLVLGGYIAGAHAGLVCGTWPSCNGGPWFPTLQGLVGLQVAHRLMAYTLLGLAWVHAVVQRGRAGLARPALLLAALVTVQAALGVANVLLHLPVEVTLLHSAGAASVFLTTAWQLYTVLVAWSPRVARLEVA
ncbi:MAG TPA: COX15/CtaA family protein [Myxococcota bacterium]|nr:COX15/CtaA family protein [Myxococcota bacterium]